MLHDRSIMHDHLDKKLEKILPLLHRRARRLIACPEEAKDLAQEAAMKLWIKHMKGARIEDDLAYATTAIHNLARSRWRGRRDWDELTEDMAATEPEAPARIACAELNAALTQLPRPQSELLRLVAAGETSPARLAEITGQPKGTVMSRLARARATLRSILGLARSAPSRDLVACD